MPDGTAEAWRRSLAVKTSMHNHRFDLKDWPFQEPANVTAITTVKVLEEEHPALLVTHDEEDGMWQVLCGTTNDPEDGRIACLGCLYDLDPTIGELADLPLGWRAWREAIGTAWHREVREAEED